MFIFLLFYIGIAQSFQPTYYSGFSAFFQLYKKDKNRSFQRFYSLHLANLS